MRDVALSEFRTQLVKRNLIKKSLNIAIVGGSADEPELSAFSDNSSVTFFGISRGQSDDSFVYLDLNDNPLELSPEYLNAFDIVICNNVLEHLHNVSNGFANLCALVASSGCLWVVVPNCTFWHGSPDYFSAGYSVDYLKIATKKNGLAVLDSGNFANCRQYRFEHLLGLWPTPGMLKYPLISYFPVAGSFSTKFLYQLKTFHVRLFLSLSKNKVTNSQDFASISWIFAERRNSS
jgi:hypothetical protein